MHSSRALALASILPNCSSRHLYQYSCQPAVYDCNLELKGHCWYFFQILGKVVPSTFHKQFRVCHGLEDKEKKWALKRRVRGLNMNFFFFFLSKGEDRSSCFSREDWLQEGGTGWLVTDLVQLLRGSLLLLSLSSGVSISEFLLSPFFVIFK